MSELNWEAYDELPAELQAAVDINQQVVSNITGEEVQTRD